MELGNVWMAHKKLILAIIGTISALMLSIGIYFFILAFGPKQITLTVDDTKKSIETQAATVEELLAEHHITRKESDKLTPGSDTPITENMTVHLQTSWAIPVQADGHTKMIHTIKRDVASVLTEAGITLRPQDQVQPALPARISEGTSISITRIDEKIVQLPKELPFQEVRKQDASLVKGETRVVTKGQQGKAIVHYKLKLENGKEVARELVKTEVLTPKQDRILAIGTKRKVVAAALTSRGGQNFRPRQVLTGVTLTAYSAWGGGKSPDSPHWGKTATGVHATEGRTIAVDPRVVPLGWWVYIDGIGYRRAEDTGSAVKGNKMDVFFNSRQEARHFGRQGGRTVYIIGPKLP